MVLFDDNTDIYFGGNQDADTAYVAVGIKGHASPQQFEQLGSDITNSLSNHLNIPPNRIYISYQEFDTYSWSGSLL
jgi:phenylpyruvate tautomerase PptA (4-oxalocrotonate tautomerase family)